MGWVWSRINVLVCLGNEQEGAWQGGGRAELVLFGLILHPNHFQSPQKDEKQEDYLMGKGMKEKR